MDGQLPEDRRGSWPFCAGVEGRALQMAWVCAQPVVTGPTRGRREGYSRKEGRGKHRRELGRRGEDSLGVGVASGVAGVE